MITLIDIYDCYSTVTDFSVLFFFFFFLFIYIFFFFFFFFFFLFSLLGVVPHSFQPLSSPRVLLSARRKKRNAWRLRFASSDERNTTAKTSSLAAFSRKPRRWTRRRVYRSRAAWRTETARASVPPREALLDRGRRSRVVNASPKKKRKKKKKKKKEKIERKILSEESRGKEWVEQRRKWIFCNFIEKENEKKRECTVSSSMSMGSQKGGGAERKKN